MAHSEWQIFRRELVTVFMYQNAPELSVIDLLKAILFHTFPCRQATRWPHSKGGSFREEGKKNDKKIR